LSLDCIFSLFISCNNSNSTETSWFAKKDKPDLQPVALKLDKSDSIKIVYNTITENNVEKEINGKKSGNLNIVDMGMVYNIKKDSNERYKILLQYNRLKAKMKAGDEDEQILDANTDPSSDAYVPEDKMLSVFKNVQIHAKVSAQGKVLSLSGQDEIAHNMYQFANNSPKSVEIIKNIVSKYASADFYKASIEKSFQILPFATLKAGDTWEKNDTLQIEFKLPVKRHTN
jgi:hypothetical protein